MSVIRTSMQQSMRESRLNASRKAELERLFAEARAELLTLRDDGMTGADVQLALAGRLRLVGPEPGTILLGSVHLDFADVRVYVNVFGPLPKHGELANGVVR